MAAAGVVSPGGPGLAANEDGKDRLSPFGPGLAGAASRDRPSAPALGAVQGCVFHVPSSLCCLSLCVFALSPVLRAVTGVLCILSTKPWLCRLQHACLHLVMVLFLQALVRHVPCVVFCTYCHQTLPVPSACLHLVSGLPLSALVRRVPTEVWCL